MPVGLGKRHGFRLAARPPFTAGAACSLSHMSKPTLDERVQLDALHESVYERGLGGIKRTASADALSAFVLCGTWLDYTARLHAGRIPGKQQPTGADAWRGFFKAYLHEYRDYWEKFYNGFRSKLSHHFAVVGFRLTHHNPEHHWTPEGEDRLLHLGTFIAQLERAYKQFRSDLERNAALRRRVLERFRELPPISVGTHRPDSSVATSWTSIPASFSTGSAAIAASGSWSPPPSKRR